MKKDFERDLSGVKARYKIDNSTNGKKWTPIQVTKSGTQPIKSDDRRVWSDRSSYKKVATFNFIENFFFASPEQIMSNELISVKTAVEVAISAAILGGFYYYVPNLIVPIIVLVVGSWYRYFSSLKKTKSVLDPGLWKQFPLVEKIRISHNVALYRFALPNSNDVLGLPIGQHISVQAEINDKLIQRSYTPTSSDDDLGHFDLVVKTYPTGNISKWFDELKIGEKITVKGPKGQFKYRPGLVRALGMIAGGTGITPMLQIIRAVCKNPRDKTRINLIYANVTSDDILLKDELDSLASEHEKFSVYYTLDKPPQNWAGGSGFVTPEMIQKYCPRPADDIKILLCGPLPMVNAMSKNCESLGYEKSRSISKLELNKMREKFQNRIHAGNILAEEVAKKYNNVNNDVIVLALPRGGVPVGFQIAQKIKAPFDVFLVRKIGVEGYEELAMGAITETSRIFNEDIISMLHIDQKSIDRVIQRESAELQRRNQKYRKGKPAPNVTGKIIILVDDGIATGATIRAAYTSLKKLNPSKIVVAVPVAAPDTLTKIGKEVDDTICPLVPRTLSGIGQWYHDFSQTEDDEVTTLLARAEEVCPVPTISAEDTKKYQTETILE
ncbi:5488_t:CDS:10 [Acaulospora colombiana]|uniref:5488_t:CDS:1 n=1 Tax=Acaulospora colombiana TaxID=27376 RepID=A0ACA9LL45_9GLOM|nr:5488_t:CDS:10 [Acaulospora colombiana]